MRETRVRSLGWEDPLEKEMVTHSSILVSKISWTGNLVGYSPWGLKVSDMTERLHFHFQGSNECGDRREDLGWLSGGPYDFGVNVKYSIGGFWRWKGLCLNSDFPTDQLN